MKPDPVADLARAVLYEGYLLYPYHRTALKNRQRWNFGVLFPRAFCSQPESSETWLAQTECLFQGTPDANLEVTIRFLQQSGCGEIVEREIPSGVLRLADLIERAALLPICFEKCFTDDFETPRAILLPHEAGGADLQVRPTRFVGRGDSTVASSLKGCVEVMVAPAANGICKLTVRILNQSPFLGGDRDTALESAFISIHSLLSVQHGCFHSLIDPPEALREMAAECRNIGMWPVLVGSEGTSDRMLSCAIVLYDNPKISAASPGDFFDATEIDELLALRIRTLSEAEKAEARNGPPAIRAMLERSDGLSEEDLCRLHASMQIKNTAACPYRPGDRVRLRPAGRADIFDLVLAGKAASIISVEQDWDGQFHLCVIVEEDPGKDLGLEGKPGHRFFFRTDEVERL